MSDESQTDRTSRLTREVWWAPLRDERDRYRTALERIADLGDHAARIAREALNDGTE